MSAVATIDYPRLVELLDLDHADTLKQQVELLQGRRAELLESIEETCRALNSGRWSVMREPLERLQATRQSDIDAIEEALRDAGQPLEDPTLDERRDQ